MGTIPKWKKCPKCSRVIDRDADFCEEDQPEAALRVNSAT